MANQVLGVIGGSGVYELEGLEGVHEVDVSTPFGAPSDALIVGNLGDTKLVFLARHGQGHRIPPHQINYRANIYAMKEMGVQWLLSVTAVGSLKEEIRPGDFVVLDQFVDRTTGRDATFFDTGFVAHVSMAEPVSQQLAEVVLSAARAEVQDDVATVHSGGSLMVINGPQFSTRAESNFYRQIGMDIIGMTGMPEAKLAREAEISYSALAMCTDYDCWREDDESVTVEAVVAIARKNASTARKIVARVARHLPQARTCPAQNALDGAVMVDTSIVPSETLEPLQLLVGKYIK